jgi:hypothetical protein
MNKLINWVMFLTLSTGTMLQAQTTNFGSLQGHVAYVFPQISTLPGGFGAPAGTIGFGSSGYGTLGGRWLIGGSGFGTFDPGTNFEQARVATSMGMGFADLGYLVSNQGAWRSHVYVGIGGGGIDVAYENRTENTLRIADNLQIAGNERGKIGAGGLGWQAGFSLNRLLYNPEKQEAGWKIGLDVGLFQFPVMSRWNNDATDQQLTGVGRPEFWGGLVRLTIGGSF